MHLQLKTADNQTVAVVQWCLVASAQGLTIAQQSIAAAVDDEETAATTNHLRVHSRDRALRIIEHQGAACSTADGAAGFTKKALDRLARWIAA
jgi:hypothetical protein